MTKLSDIKGVGEATEGKLNSLSIFSVRELLDFLPRQYIDLSAACSLSDASDGDYCVFDGVLCEKSKPRKKNNLSVFNAEVRCGGLFVKLVWFNQSYVAQRLETGEEYCFFGKIKIGNFSYEIANPHFCKKSERSAFSGVCPIYPTKGLIPQGTFARLTKEALKHCPESIISAEIEQKYGLMTLSEAYRNIHDPITKDNKEALKRVALEKLTERIAAFSFAKNYANKSKNRSYAKAANFDAILKNLPFSPTESQNAAIEKIIGNLKKPTVMNTVLCGDVGSGKTLVAAVACYFVIDNGFQAAVAAPTEILARQHYRFFCDFYKNSGIEPVLLVGGTPAREKKIIYEEAANGKIRLIIGTHAVFNDKLSFDNLGLAVVDEQHRFGVAQRNSLVEKGRGADVLTLSATPIPRTMYIVAYGEAEFVTIDRRIKGNIKTSVVPAAKRDAMFKYIAERSEETKTYIIAPKISDAEGIERESCEELFKETAKYLPAEKIGLMHGRMKAEEKTAVMEKFRNGTYRVLVATTVVEVGVDVPDATIIVVADADGFGLATLHQLRGRVGRRGDPSFCFLLGKDCERLKILTSNDDGFRIAEEDFSLRGGGEMFGLEQTGVGSLKYVTAKTLKLASECAETVDFSRFGQRIYSVAKEFSLYDVTLG